MEPLERLLGPLEVISGGSRGVLGHLGALLGLLGYSWGSLRASWGPLGPTSRLSKRHSQRRAFTRPILHHTLMFMGLHFGSQNRSTWHPKRVKNSDDFQDAKIALQDRLGTLLGPSWAAPISKNLLWLQRSSFFQKSLCFQVIALAQAAGESPRRE